MIEKCDRGGEAGKVQAEGRARPESLFVRLALSIAIGCIAVFALVGCSGDAGFPRGQTVTIVVPYGRGGMDSYARAIAPYFQEYLPGARIVVKNMPGEGGIVGKNYVYAAKPDGLTICFATSTSSLFTEWVGRADVRYRTIDFSYLGRISAEDHLLVVSANSRFSSLKDILRAGQVRMGFAGLGSDDYYVSLLTAGLFGIAMDARTDYASTDDLLLACVRGEVDAALLSVSNLLPLIDAGTVIPIAVYDRSRLAALPAVPTIFEFGPSAGQGLLESLVSLYALDRTLFGPPGLPPGRLEVLRRALDRTMADPQFLMAMDKLGRPVDYLSGNRTVSLLAGILRNEGALRQLVRASGSLAP